MSDRLFISKEQAIDLLNPGSDVHAFTNTNGLLLGCDISRKILIEKINNSGHKDLEIGGETCKSLKHALVIHLPDYNLFVETNMDKVSLIDK